MYKLLVHFRLCMEVEKDEPMAAAAVAAMSPEYGGGMMVVLLFLSNGRSVKERSGGRYGC